MGDTPDSCSKLASILLDQPHPVGVPLIAKYKPGFAFKTIGHRLPIILTKIIDQLARDKIEIGEFYGSEAREEIKQVIGELAKLKNEMQTNKPLTKVGDAVWDTYLQEMEKRLSEEVRWFSAPWLHVECYMYERLYQAFQSTNNLKGYDVFRKQKEDGWWGSKDAGSVLGKFLLDNVPKGEDSVFLEEMLEISLWGNKCDLSLSQGEENSQKHDLVDQLSTLKKSILCDDSKNFWDTLKKKKLEKKENPLTLAYVLDNAGFELFTDLCFADALLKEVDRVDFYVKEMPWFVSDALKSDVLWLIEALESDKDHDVLRTLGKRWRGFLDEGRWTIVESPFWTYPHPYNEMEVADPKLYQRLKDTSLLLFKGDLNYRKLIGDINWLPETPFRQALQGFTPCPLLTLRTLKADCIAGLGKGVAEQARKKDPEWMVTGEFGVIQFCEK